MAKKRPFKGFAWRGKNQWCEALGVKFPSRREAAHWVLLNSYLQLGLISLLRRQTAFELSIPGKIDGKPVYIGEYRADFTYLDEKGRLHVVDAKPPSMITVEFEIKRRLMLAIHGIRIELV